MKQQKEKLEPLISAVPMQELEQNIKRQIQMRRLSEDGFR